MPGLRLMCMHRRKRGAEEDERRDDQRRGDASYRTKHVVIMAATRKAVKPARPDTNVRNMSGQ